MGQKGLIKATLHAAKGPKVASEVEQFSDVQDFDKLRFNFIRRYRICLEDLEVDLSMNRPDSVRQHQTELSWLDRDLALVGDGELLERMKTTHDSLWKQVEFRRVIVEKKLAAYNGSKA